MKLLVTGNSGQLAQSLAELARPGVEIICAGRPSFDITHPDSIRRVIDRESPDVVINTAAYTAVDKAEQETGLAMQVNAVGAKHVAEACAASNRPLVHISTDYVFDGHLDRPYLESDRPHPLNAYGRSKLAGEEAVAAACGRAIILRTTWVFSPFGSNFLKTILRLARERSELSIVNDQIGAPTYAPDLANAIVEIAPRIAGNEGVALSGIYHVTAQGEVPWSGFAEAIVNGRAFASHPVQIIPIPTKNYPTPARRPANSRLNCDKFEAAFGQRLPHWQDGMARCLQRLDSAGPPNQP